MSNSNRQPKLIHVRRPLKRITLTFEPVVPLDGPVTDGPLIRVGRPLKRIEPMLAPAPSAVTVLEVPLVSGQRGDQTFVALNSMIQKMNAIEALDGRAGVWVDETRSGVREGKIELVLTPNDPADAIETCKRVADYLFAAVRPVSSVTVKVYAADEPETPVYELAA